MLAAAIAMAAQILARAGGSGLGLVARIAFGVAHARPTLGSVVGSAGDGPHPIPSAIMLA
jgi:hypothetical protein